MKDYRTYLSIGLLLLFISEASFAQKGYNYLNLSPGVNLESGYNFKIGIERSNAQYNGWELYFEGYERSETKNWMLGLLFKKNILRSRNLYSSLNFGGQGGTDEENFIGGVNAGPEIGYFFFDNFAFFLYQKNDYVFGAEDGFRHYIMAGLKIPF